MREKLELIRQGLQASEELTDALMLVILAAAERDQAKMGLAIKAVLDTAGTIPMPAPEGVEFDMHVFIVCPSSGMETRLAFPGNRMLPPREDGPIDVLEIIDSLGVQESKRLRAYGADWRVMTRDEITAYKMRQIRATQH